MSGVFWCVEKANDGGNWTSHAGRDNKDSEGKVVSVKNIVNGFRVTDIHPFLSTKFLRRVASSSSPEPQSRPSTSPNLLTPFNKSVFTDSPIDFNAVQRANVALNTLLDSKIPLPTPAKFFVRHLTRSHMRLHTRNTIVEQQNDEQRAMLQGGKRQLSGKTRVIVEKHLMTAEELIGVRDAEEVTKQRKGTRKEMPGLRSRKNPATSLNTSQMMRMSRYLIVLR